MARGLAPSASLSSPFVPSRVVSVCVRIWRGGVGGEGGEGGSLSTLAMAGSCAADGASVFCAGNASVFCDLCGEGGNPPPLPRRFRLCPQLARGG